MFRTRREPAERLLEANVNKPSNRNAQAHRSKESFSFFKFEGSKLSKVRGFESPRILETILNAKLWNALPEESTVFYVAY